MHEEANIKHFKDTKPFIEFSNNIKGGYQNIND